MMVLAMDVGRNGAADSDIAGTRCDRHEESLGNQRMKESIDADSGLGGDEDMVRVGGCRMHGERIDINGLDHSTTAVLRGVAIAATESTGEQTAGVALRKRATQFGR